MAKRKGKKGVAITGRQRAARVRNIKVARSAKTRNTKKAIDAFASAWGGSGKRVPGGATGKQIAKSYFSKKKRAFNLSGHTRGDMARVRASFKVSGVKFKKLKIGATSFYAIGD